jgi:hypothetical protein
VTNRGRFRGWSDVDRFEAQIVPSEDGDCWLWIGAVSASGYGNFKAAGRQTSPHRWSYEYHIAEIPAGLTLDHLCRVKVCVNPYHLEPVSRGENTRRAQIKTHCWRGHELSPENRYLIPSTGKTACRPCATIRQAQYVERKRQKAA